MKIVSSLALVLFIHLATDGLQSSFAFQHLPSNISQNRLDPCGVCRQLAKSFAHGMDKTSKGHFTGGDTAWEEDRGIVYKDSEVRLAEIQLTLCHELKNENSQCMDLAVEYEDDLDEWWRLYKRDDEDIFEWMCIRKNGVCCPDEHYGLNCSPCIGFPSNVCSGHGTCDGAGTRTGTGACKCKTGYVGTSCNSCAKKFFEAYNEGEKLICSACHKACKDGCTGAGIKHCLSCIKGWEKDDEFGCLDINECLETDSRVCRANEFCVNTEGSYSCIACDKSCDGCFGDGPDMCEKCAENYVLRDKVCIDGSTVGRSLHMNLTRYFTYLGLCIATCIIFQKNVTVAAVIGIAVAAYISVSEYLLSTSGL